MKLLNNNDNDNANNNANVSQIDLTNNRSIETNQ